MKKQIKSNVVKYANIKREYESLLNEYQERYGVGHAKELRAYLASKHNMSDELLQKILYEYDLSDETVIDEVRHIHTFLKQYFEGK